MEVTEVRVFPVTNEERLKAYATITIDNVFLIRDLRVINGNNGLFVAMPSRKMKDGTFKDIAHPLNSDTRQMIESKVLAEYERELANPTKKADTAPKSPEAEPKSSEAEPKSPESEPKSPESEER